MSLFPSSPTNGQTVTVNGILYTYNSSQTGWIRTASGVSGDFIVNGNETITGNLSISGNATVSGNIYNTRINIRTANNGATTSGTITPNADTSDQYNLIGLNGTVTIAAPSGTFTDGQKLTLRIKDSGSAQTLNWTTGSANNYRVIGTTLPTTTTAGKVTYVGCVYNSQDTYWDVVAVTTQA